MKSISDPERFEFGEEVLDNIEPNARAGFAKKLNGILDKVGLLERVRLLKEIDGSSRVRGEEQKKDFLIALNRLFEKARGEPSIARSIIPKEWVEREQEDIIEKYRVMAEEYYGVAQPLNITEETSVSWGKSNMEFLESEHMLDDLVKYGSTLIKDFEDLWHVVFLAQASTMAPPIMQGEKKHRAQMHIMIAGEYSTSKSGLVGYISKMFPRVVRCSDTTGPGLMGSVRKDGSHIMGLAEESDKSILVLDEFDKLLKRQGGMDGILRCIMEDQYFKRNLSFGTLEYETRPSILALANPKRDVFYSDEVLAKQIPFKTGLLSRFDYIRTLAYTPEKVNSIAGFIAKNSFRTSARSGCMTTRDVLQTYYAMQSSLKQNEVYQVGSDESLLMDIHSRFVKLQKEIDGVPLLAVRDFMSALRVFNSSAIMFHRQRKIDQGIVMASDQDRDNAIYVMDNTIKSRETLLRSSRRNDISLTPVEKAYGQLMTLMEREGAVPKQDAVAYLQSTMGIGFSTAYKYLNLIVERDQGIKQNGLRDAELVLAR